MPRFEDLLDELKVEREEALKARPGPPLVRLAWLVLRYGHTGELARKLPEWVGLFAQVHLAQGLEKGLARGREEGLERGLNEGLERKRDSA